MAAPVGSRSCWDSFISCICCTTEVEDRMSDLARAKLEEQRKHEANFRPAHGKHYSADMLNEKDFLKWSNFLDSQKKSGGKE